MAMTHNQLVEKIKDMIVDVAGDDDATTDMDGDLFEEGYLDSMGAIELLVTIQDELGVSIAPTEVQRSEMNTPNLIIKQVEKRLK